MATDSAGILPYRPAPAGPAVLPGQMGDAFPGTQERARRPVPKGEPGADEEPLAAAVREFAEELGCSPFAGTPQELGTVRQPGGKRRRYSRRQRTSTRTPTRPRTYRWRSVHPDLSRHLGVSCLSRERVLTCGSRTRAPRTVSRALTSASWRALWVPKNSATVAELRLRRHVSEPTPLLRRNRSSGGEDHVEASDANCAQRASTVASRLRSLEQTVTPFRGRQHECSRLAPVAVDRLSTQDSRRSTRRSQNGRFTQLRAASRDEMPCGCREPCYGP